MTETHAETGLPIEQCPGQGDHAAHNWNVYDPTAVKLSRVNPDGDRTCTGFNPFAGTDWDARLLAAVEATITARAARRDQRAAMNQRREYGLAARHAAKESRTGTDDDDTQGADR